MELTPLDALVRAATRTGQSARLVALLFQDGRAEDARALADRDSAWDDPAVRDAVLVQRHGGAEDQARASFGCDDVDLLHDVVTSRPSRQLIRALTGRQDLRTDTLAWLAAKAPTDGIAALYRNPTVTGRLRQDVTDRLIGRILGTTGPAPWTFEPSTTYALSATEGVDAITALKADLLCDRTARRRLAATDPDQAGRLTQIISTGEAVTAAGGRWVTDATRAELTADLHAALDTAVAQPFGMLPTDGIPDQVDRADAAHRGIADAWAATIYTLACDTPDRDRGRALAWFAWRSTAELLAATNDLQLAMHSRRYTVRPDVLADCVAHDADGTIALVASRGGAQWGDLLTALHDAGMHERIRTLVADSAGDVHDGAWAATLAHPNPAIRRYADPIACPTDLTGHTQPWDGDTPGLHFVLRQLDSAADLNRWIAAMGRTTTLEQAQAVLHTVTAHRRS